MKEKRAGMAGLLVETGDEEPALLSVARLAAEVSGSEALLSEATALLEKEDVAALVAKLAGSTLLTAAPEKDAEAAFLVLCHAAGKLPAAQGLTAVTTLLERVADAAGDAPALRLRVLFLLFNATPAARSRYAVLLRTLQFATATGQAEAVAHVAHRADAWAADWALSAPELRALRLAVYNLLNKSKPAGKEAFAALVAYLALYENEPAPVLAEVRDAAASAATHFIAAPDVFQCDLLDMAAVRRVPSATLTLLFAATRSLRPPPRPRRAQTTGERRQIQERAQAAHDLPHGCAEQPPQPLLRAPATHSRLSLGAPGCAQAACRTTWRSTRRRQTC